MYEYVSATKLLDDLQQTDFIKFKNIDTVNWIENIAELNKIAINNPSYSDSILSDKWEKWDSSSKEIQSNWSSSAQWGYTQHNTKLWKTTNKPYNLEFSSHAKIIESLPLSNAIAVPTLQRPGQTLPLHVDKFFYIKQKLNKNLHKNIIRFILFLEDWDTGHILQVGNTILSHWKAGDTFVWHPDRVHLGANVGIAPKWTCNITGILT